VDIYSHVFLISTLVGSEWSVSRPGRFTSVERALNTHWIGCWVDPIASQDRMEKWEFLTLPGLELRNVRRPARRIRWAEDINKGSVVFPGGTTKSTDTIRSNSKFPARILSNTSCLGFCCSEEPGTHIETNVIVFYDQLCISYCLPLRSTDQKVLVW
jgi:hypothetical protein